MNTKLIGCLAMLAFVASAHSATANIVYDVSLGSGQNSVTGTITTDGKTGALSTGNIVGFNLQFTSRGVTESVSSASQGVSFSIRGTDFVATPAGLLTFDFGSKADSYFRIDVGPSDSAYLCFDDASRSCFGKDSGSRSDVALRVFTNRASGIRESGDLEVASAVAAVPEPSTWAMMILGFFGIGWLAYRRKNNPSFA